MEYWSSAQKLIIQVNVDTSLAINYFYLLNIRDVGYVEIGH
jgi:hypothetical protein